MNVSFVVYAVENGKIAAWVNTSPKIKGYGNTKCEALNNLLDTYRAIAQAINLLEERKQCDV